MKTKHLLVSLLAILLIAAAGVVNAQTINRNLNADFEPFYIPCIDRTVTGTVTFHFTYHLDQKTGKISRMHWNFLQCDLYDVTTSEKLIILDTGSDNIGLNFQWFNNMNSSNGFVDTYDVKDGWLDEYMPDALSDEGMYVEMNWTFKIGGETHGASILYQIHRNSQGEITSEHSKSIWNCIY